MDVKMKALVRAAAGKHIGTLRSLRDFRGQRSWSQEGEDRILWRYLNYQTSGFYVDVGAHHPFRFSNTCLLKKAGWQGINIDAMPGSMGPFRKHRPDDVNLEIGISETPGTAAFYVFKESALNTFSQEVADGHARNNYPWDHVVEVPILPLRDVLQEHRPAGTIDLLTVDAEGHDLSVLQSNDWQRFRPKIVLAESLGRSIDDLAADPVARFMLNTGYAAVAKTVNTVLYADRTDLKP